MRKQHLFLIGLVLSLLLLSACSQGSTPQVAAAELPQTADTATPRTLTVSATGKASTEPDIAIVTLAVETRHRDLGRAVSENKTQAAQVIQAVKALGVADKDIQTANFQVQQERNYDNQGNLVLGPYMVHNEVVVTVRDLEQLGALLDAALQAGANQISGLSFQSSHWNEAQLEARLNAVAEAKRQAEAIAQAAGVTIEGIQSISFGGYAPPQPVYKAAMVAEAASAVPIEAGELSIQATVTIVFLIR